MPRRAPPPAPTDPLMIRDLPAGPPLYLERAGNVARHLGPFVGERRRARMNSVLDGRTRHLTALLEHVHDPHNIAACVRSCDAFGIQDLHIVPQAPDEDLQLNREVAQGTQRWLAVHLHDTAEAAIAAIKGAGYQLAVSDLGGDVPPVPLEALPLDSPLCVAFGNERTGISPRLRAAADLRFVIPMQGFVDSLNISVAFALSAYTTRRRLDASRDAPGDLSATARAELLDRWLFDDVTGAREVLEELADRQR